MRRMMFTLVTLAALLMGINIAFAQQDLVDTVANGCKTELEKYCNQVTPGQGRVLACLYAYGDKLSSKCEYALYDAAVQLERAVAALSYVANECDADWKNIAHRLSQVKDVCSNVSKRTTNK